MIKFIPRTDIGKVYEATVLWSPRFRDFVNDEEADAGYWLVINEHLSGSWEGDKFISTSMSFHTEDIQLVVGEKNEDNYNEAIELADEYIDELIQRFQPKVKFSIKAV